MTWCPLGTLGHVGELLVRLVGGEEIRHYEQPGERVEWAAGVGGTLVVTETPAGGGYTTTTTYNAAAWVAIVEVEAADGAGHQTSPSPR